MIASVIILAPTFPQPDRAADGLARRRFHCRTSSCGPRAAGTSARSTSRTPSSTRGRWASRRSSTSYSRCSSSWHGASRTSGRNIAQWDGGVHEDRRGHGGGQPGLLDRVDVRSHPVRRCRTPGRPVRLLRTDQPHLGVPRRGVGRRRRPVRARRTDRSRGTGDDGSSAALGRRRWVDPDPDRGVPLLRRKHRSRASPPRFQWAERCS